MKVNELFEAVVKKWEIEEVDVEEMITLLNKHCKDSLKDLQSGNVLYRGFYNGGTKPKVIDSSTGERTSRDTKNIYQIMMEASEHLNDVPHRSKSFICSGSATDAYNYGDLFAIIPFDGVPVAVSDEYDMLFKRLPTVGSDLRQFDSNLAAFVSMYGAKIGRRASVDEMNRLFAEVGPELFMLELMEWQIFRGSASPGVKRSPNIIANVYKQESGNDLPELKTSPSSKVVMPNSRALDVALLQGLNERGNQLYKELKARPTEMFTVLASYVFTKESAGITVQYPGELKLGRVEAWVSGKCVVIPIDVFAAILQTMKKQKMLRDARTLNYLKRYIL